MAETFIEACPSWILEKKDKDGKTLSVSTLVRYYKTEGPFEDIIDEKIGETRTYYNRHLIEEVKIETKPGDDIVSTIEAKIATEVSKESLPADAKVFNNPVLLSYKRAVSDG